MTEDKRHDADIIEEALRRVEGGFTPAQITAAIKGMDERQLAKLAWRTKWCSTRHEHQIPPNIRSGTWLLLGGRGSGKTRVGAEEVGFAAACAGRGDRSLVAAPTAGDLRGVCFEGDSGLLNVVPTPLIKKYVRSLGELTLHNGAFIGGIPASEPSRFRGPQWHRAWCDEVAAWADNGQNDEETWDLLTLSVRLGHETWKLATTTPKPTRLIYRFVEEAKRENARIVITPATTYDNIENLSEDFRAEILKYEGTQLGLQEIYAQILDPEATGIIKRSWWQQWTYKKPLPAMDLVVMSLDTAYSDKHVDKTHRTDPSAGSTWGCFRERLDLPDGRHVYKPRVILLACWQEKLNAPDLIKKIKEDSKRRYGGEEMRSKLGHVTDVRNFVPEGKVPDNVGRKTDYIVIEEKASGKSIRQMLAAQGIATRGYNPGKADKLQRLHVMSPILANGYVWAPESRVKGKFHSALEPLIAQVCGYSGKNTIIHDDLLDTTTQALRFINDYWLHYLPKAGAAVVNNREDIARPFSPRLVNPYGV